MPLTVAYSELLLELFTSQEKNVNPAKINEVIIKDLNYKFEKNSYQIIIFIIENLHKELKKNPSKNNCNSPNKCKIDFENETNIHDIFINELRENRSKINDIFYGISRTKMKCYECNGEEYSFEKFGVLSCELKLIREYKKKEKGNINLYDVFRYFFEFENNNKRSFFCHKCEKKKQCHFKKDIYGLPLIIIIKLEGYNSKQEKKENLEIPERLDLQRKKLLFLKIHTLNFIYVG